MGAWIEISQNSFAAAPISVAPFVGAWIEIGIWAEIVVKYTLSLPSWERGLKSSIRLICTVPDVVAPFVGAWIEIISIRQMSLCLIYVAPFVGAWIEI